MIEENKLKDNHDHDSDTTKNETGNKISKSSLKYGGLFKH